MLQPRACATHVENQCVRLVERALMSSTVILRLRCFLAAGLAAVPGAGAAALPPQQRRHVRWFRV